MIDHRAVIPGTEIGSRVVGIDVGGANLKAALTTGHATSRCFALWKTPDGLDAAITAMLRELFAGFVRFNGGVANQPTAGNLADWKLAVTMTGELADCFVDRGVGVAHIVRHVLTAAQQLSIADVRFYGVDGIFHRADAAIQLPDIIAAANWHAMASYWATRFPRRGVLIDIGSTTTDITPITAGRVATTSRTDHDRLAARELVYIGCRRTPVCALLDELLVWRREGKLPVPVMNEVFATMDDVQLVLGHQVEAQHDNDTADGQPRTKLAATNRLARMIGLDHRHIDQRKAVDLATQVLDSARNRISSAVSAVATAHFAKWDTLKPADSIQGNAIILAGHGSRLLDRESLSAAITSPHLSVVDLADFVGDETSRSGPAHAAAMLLVDPDTTEKAN